MIDYAKVAKMLDDYEPLTNFGRKEDLLFWYNRLRTNLLNSLNAEKGEKCPANKETK